MNKNGQVTISWPAHSAVASTVLTARTFTIGSVPIIKGVSLACAFNGSQIQTDPQKTAFRVFRVLSGNLFLGVLGASVANRTPLVDRFPF